MFLVLQSGRGVSMNIVLFAQAQVDPISGGAGWIGAGLLGAVLSWLLLKHLPDKDKLIRELIADKDAQIQTVLQTKWAALSKLTDDYKESLKSVAEHCEREMAHISTAWEKEITRLASAIESLKR